MDNQSIKDKQETQAIADQQQYVTFNIKDEVYGVSILKVQEIIKLTPITKVPNTLPFMKGVINLRGSVVPVIDMRLKFEMHAKEYEETTVIIIVEVKNWLIGMIVDAVADVISIPIKSIQDTPHYTSKIESDFIEGIVQKNEELIIILNIDKILSSEEFAIVNKSLD